MCALDRVMRAASARVGDARVVLDLDRDGRERGMRRRGVALVRSQGGRERVVAEDEGTSERMMYVRMPVGSVCSWGPARLGLGPG